MDLHPVKVETFDVESLLNVDPKGFERVVDVYEPHDWGLYMARGADHPRFGYLESWLLPGVHLRVNIFHFRKGENSGQRLYIDVAKINREGSLWTTRDLFVDFVTYDDGHMDILDLDELVGAQAAGFIEQSEAYLAFDTSVALLAGVREYDGDVQAWLHRLGMPSTWAHSVELTPCPK